MKNIYIIGRYPDTEKLSGSTKFIKRLFEYIEPNSGCKFYFIDFVFGYKLKLLPRKISSYVELTRSGQKVFLKVGIASLIGLLIKNKPHSILLSGLEGYGIVALLLAKLMKSKSYYTVHGLYLFELLHDKKNIEPFFFNFKYKLMERIIINSVSNLVAYSKTSIEQLHQYFSLKKQKVILTSHGIDDCFFYKKSNFNHGEKLTLIYIGGLTRYQKGFEFLLNSLNDIEFHLNIFLCDVGQKTVQSKRMNNSNINFILTNSMTASELSELYKHCDIFIMPSKFETFGIAALEAMASSLVTIVTSTSGVSSFISDGENGYIIDYGDSNQLTKILQNLHNDRKLLEQVGKTAHRSVQSMSWGNIIPFYSQLLTSEND